MCECQESSEMTIINGCSVTEGVKSSPNCAQRFMRNKYTFFTKGGTVALRSPSHFLQPESYRSAAIQRIFVEEKLFDPGSNALEHPVFKFTLQNDAYRDFDKTRDWLILYFPNSRARFRE